jgi:hypothetical protein
VVSTGSTTPTHSPRRVQGAVALPVEAMDKLFQHHNFKRSKTPIAAYSYEVNPGDVMLGIDFFTEIRYACGPYAFNQMALRIEHINGKGFRRIRLDGNR